MSTETFSIRTDPEFDAALAELGVTTNSRNRTAIIKRAVIAAAAAQRDQVSLLPGSPGRPASVHEIDTPDGPAFVVRFTQDAA